MKKYFALYVISLPIYSVPNHVEKKPSQYGTVEQFFKNVDCVIQQSGTVPNVVDFEVFKNNGKYTLKYKNYVFNGCVHNAMIANLKKYDCFQGFEAQGFGF